MTPLLTPPSSIWMSLKVVFLDNKKLIISEKHLKSALNPILEIRRTGYTGAQVQILYLPYSLSYKRSKNVDIQVTACNVFASFYLCEYVFEYVLLKYQYILRIALLFLLLSVI